MELILILGKKFQSKYFFKMSGFKVKIFSRISRNFSREMGQFFSHLARNQKREKCACLILQCNSIMKNWFHETFDENKFRFFHTMLLLLQAWKFLQICICTEYHSNWSKILALSIVNNILRQISWKQRLLQNNVCSGKKDFVKSKIFTLCRSY